MSKSSALIPKLAAILPKLQGKELEFAKLAIETGDFVAAGQQTGMGGSHPHLLASRLVKKYGERKPKGVEKAQGVTLAQYKRAMRTIEAISSGNFKGGVRDSAAGLRAATKLIELYTQQHPPSSEGGIQQGPLIQVCVVASPEEFEAFKNGGKVIERKANA